MERVIFNWSATARAVFRDGKKYLVAPAILIRAGVLAGSDGRLLYTSELLADNPQQWNDVPLTCRHPDTPGSAKRPEIISQQGIGEVRDAHVENNDLKADIWVDVEKAKRIDARIVSAMESGEPMELSTGLFVARSVPAANGAQHHGRPYSTIITKLAADHLAILLDQVGACSIEDGCGLGLNAMCLNSHWQQDLEAYARPHPFRGGQDILPTFTPIDWAAESGRRQSKQTPEPTSSGRGKPQGEVLPPFFTGD